MLELKKLRGCVCLCRCLSSRCDWCGRSLVKETLMMEGFRSE